MTRIARGVIASILVLAALGACSSSPKSPIINEDASVIDIADLPDIDETRTQMVELIDRARVGVTRVVPSTDPWEWRGEEANAPCTQEATGRKGGALYLQRLVSASELTDAEWNAVLPVVRDIAASAGLTKSSSPLGDAASRDVRFVSDDGRELVFLSRATTVLSGTIVCRRHGVTTP
jgi:hypothetical protein